MDRNGFRRCGRDTRAAFIFYAGIDRKVINITIQQKISGAMAASGKTQQEIASAFGISQQAFSQRLKTGKFTQQELEKMAEIMGCKWHSFFEFPNSSKAE